MIDKKDEKSTIDKVSEGVKKIWKKTVFPDMIKDKKAKKAADKKLREEAREEARKEAKPLLKEKYKKEELDKILGNKKGGKWDKLAKGFGVGNEGQTKGPNMSDKISNAFSMGKGSDSSFSNDRISRMMSTGGNDGTFADDKISRMLGNGKKNNTFADDKISKMLGGTQKQQRKTKKGKQVREETPEEKIKRMIG